MADFGERNRKFNFFNLRTRKMKEWLCSHCHKPIIIMKGAVYGKETVLSFVSSRATRVLECAKI
jgi:hypothetical protein